MSFPTSPTIGQIAKLVPTGPDYIYRGLGKWDVLAMDPNFDPSGYVTTGVFDTSQATQNTAITAASNAASAAQSTAAAAASAAAAVAASAPNASNLTSGTIPNARLPARLAPNAKRVTDWRTANENGCYYSASGSTINGPPGSDTLSMYGYYVGITVAIGTLIVFAWDGDTSPTTSKTYRCDQHAGTWGEWYQIELSKAELDTRYVLAGGGVGVLTVTDWNSASSSGLYFGDNATHGPEASGQFIAELWAVDAETAIARAVGLDGNNYVYQRAKSGNSWETVWTRVSDANGAVWHPGNMPAAQALWDDNTPNTLVKRGSTGNIKAPFGIFAGEVIITQPATVAVQSGTDGTIRWQALSKLAEWVAAQAAITSALAPIAALPSDIRLGATTSVGSTTYGTFTAPAGHVVTEVTVGDAAYSTPSGIVAKPVQKKVGGTWATVTG